MRRWSKGGDETGAVAVLGVILCAFVLFGVAALAVDLGNAYARKRHVQSQADFAALASGAVMSHTTSGTPSSSDAALLEAATYIVSDWPQTDDGAAKPSAAVMQGRLINGVLTDGEACYGTFPFNTVAPSPADPEPVAYSSYTGCVASAGEFSVLTPESLVDYGLADAMPSSPSEVDLAATATVAVKSPSTRIMPTYAVSGCDFGPQTITDPAAGHSTPVAIPALAEFDTAVNGSTTEGIGTNPSPMPLNPPVTPVPTVTISGKKLNTTTKVGFFRTAGSSIPTLVQETPTNTGVTAVTANVPTMVTSVEAVWYVRVFDGTTWSARADALPLRVGNAVLECAGVSNDGNFGALKIPRTTDTPGDWLAANMAVGLQSPLTLAIYPNATSAPATCSASPAVVSSTSNLRPGTNCVDTDTGLPANSTTAGLITGVNANKGRLDAPNTSSGGSNCGSNATDRTSRWDTGISHGGTSYSINDDLLTCFLTDSTTTLDTIVQPSYSGSAKLSADIFKSPRFMWVPVLRATPTSGGSNKYTIIDFRPGFLTDQPLTATRANMTTGASTTGATTTHNGIAIKNDSVLTAKVIFFDVDALPDSIGGNVPTTDYLGVGTRVIRLIN